MLLSCFIRFCVEPVVEDTTEATTIEKATTEATTIEDCLVQSFNVREQYDSFQKCFTLQTLVTKEKLNIFSLEELSDMCMNPQLMWRRMEKKIEVPSKLDQAWVTMCKKYCLRISRVKVLADPLFYVFKLSSYEVINVLLRFYASIGAGDAIKL